MKEEDKILRRNIKEMVTDEDMVDLTMRGTPTMQHAGKGSAKVALGRKEVEDQEHATRLHRAPISYKAKLIGREEETFDEDYDAQLRQWVQEEEDTAPLLTEDQERLINSLTNIHLPDERLKDLCRPWKDALVITLLG